MGQKSRPADRRRGRPTRRDTSPPGNKPPGGALPPAGPSPPRLSDEERTRILEAAEFLRRTPHPVNVDRLLHGAIAAEATLKDFCRARGEPFPPTPAGLVAFVKQNPVLALESPSVRFQLSALRFFAEHPGEMLVEAREAEGDGPTLLLYEVGTTEAHVPAAVAGLTTKRADSGARETLRRFGAALGHSRPVLRYAEKALRLSVERIEREAARRKRERGIPLDRTRLELAREATGSTDPDRDVLARHQAHVRLLKRKKRGEK